MNEVSFVRILCLSCEEKLDLTNNALAQQKLKNAAEVAKCELSTSMNNEINIPYIAADATGPKHLLVKISRAKLEAVRDSTGLVITLHLIELILIFHLFD